MMSDVRVAVLSFLDRLEPGSSIQPPELSSRLGLTAEQVNPFLEAAQQRREVVVLNDGSVTIARHLVGQFMKGPSPMKVSPKNEPRFRSGVFVSYSHADRDWLDRLRTHISPFIRGERLEVWDDTKIAPGANWEDEINRALGEARVAVLLVSPDFLASDFVANVELPAILRRSASDLTIMWIPIRPSAYEFTPLKNFQAAHDPGHPLATLSRAKQDEAFVAISKRIDAAVHINAVGNAFRIIDDFEPQVKAFVTGSPEPDQPVTHSWRAEQVQSSIRLVEPGGARELISANDFERLDANAQKLIRSYERTMKELFERWTELKPKRIAQDPETRQDARAQSDDVRRELCEELRGLLGFIESMGMSLQDHYAHVRYICSQ